MGFNSVAQTFDVVQTFLKKTSVPPDLRRLSVVLESVYEPLVRKRSAGGQWTVLSPPVRLLRTLHQMHFRCYFTQLHFCHLN